jgi:hypothetical protein
MMVLAIRYLVQAQHTRPDKGIFGGTWMHINSLMKVQLQNKSDLAAGRDAFMRNRKRIMVNIQH